MKENMRGAIFDWDNTLFQSGDLWDHFAKYVLKEIGIEEIIFDEDEVAAMTITEGIKYLQDIYKLEYDFKYLAAICVKLISACYNNPDGLTEGVMPFLAQLKADGIKMCIATASQGSVVADAAKKTRFRRVYRLCTDRNRSKCKKSRRYTLYCSGRKNGFVGC